jgi:hypothetical protein
MEITFTDASGNAKTFTVSQKKITPAVCDDIADPLVELSTLEAGAQAAVVEQNQEIAAIFANEDLPREERSRLYMDFLKANPAVLKNILVDQATTTIRNRSKLLRIQCDVIAGIADSSEISSAGFTLTGEYLYNNAEASEVEAFFRSLRQALGV